MGADEARSRANKMPILQVGEIVDVPIEVALMYMKLHKLKKSHWIGDGNILVLRKDEDALDVESAGDSTS